MGFDELMFCGGSGVSHRSFSTRKPAKKRVAKSTQTIPALAFVFPYHELLLRGLLKVGPYEGVKSRSNNWNYRGPVLLYTSKGKHHKVPVKAYGLNPKEFPIGAIVGVANVVDSRELVGKERLQVVRNFNNMDYDTAVNVALGIYDGDYIEPLPIGVFLTDIRRFKKPVQFKPRPGAIGIMRVPTKLVAKSLKEVGINPRSL